MSGPASRSRLPGVQGPQREPLLAIAVALGLGIYLDHAMQASWGWIVALALFVALGAAGLASRRRSALLVFVVWAALGAVRGYVSREGFASTDIGILFGEDDACPVSLKGRVATAPEIHPSDPAAPEWRRIAQTRFDLVVDEVVSDREVSATGRVAVTVEGHLLGFEPGDPVSVIGNLSTPSEPMNPGDFDFRAYLASRGVRRVVHCGHPDCVIRIEGSADPLYFPARLRSRLRAAARRVLKEQLPEQSVPLAASLLLGDRTDLSDDLNDEFAASGTMHILAISGQHVVILLLLIQYLCRLLNLSLSTTTLVLLSSVVFYAFLTDQRPPVLRATLLAFVVLAGTRWGRVAPGLNALGASAIVLLLVNPLHLFDIGAQLSFLAVAAIVWSSRLIGRFHAQSSLAPDLRAEAGPLRLFLRRTLRGIVELQLLTAAVWIFTLPLQMTSFHLAAPVGFFINVLLSPIVFLMLGAGYAFLILAMISTWLALPLMWLFSACLAFFHGIVHVAAITPFGHFETPGPPVWWNGGFYILLATGLIGTHRVVRRLAVGSIVAWAVCGLMFSLVPASNGQFTCTFVAVGHGGGILIELPDGRTLLYDAGAMAGGERASRSLRNQLWRRDRNGIDAVILSHADIDHFNALPDLLDAVPIGTVLISREFCDFRQTDVERLCDAVAARGIPFRFLAQGDVLLDTPECRIEILHPPLDFRDPHDNANSLVLDMLSAGRRILLTGDLEQRGLRRLLDLPPRRCDVLLAPHHGSKSSNTPDLARWSVPRIVITSAGRGDRVDHLASTYPHADRVLSTGTFGCITVTLGRDGEVDVETWLRPGSFTPLP